MNSQYNSSYIFSITLVATLGGLLFGYDTAVISGTVESLNTVFVAEFVPEVVVRIVTGSYGVDVELLHNLNVLNHAVA